MVNFSVRALATHWLSQTLQCRPSRADVDTVAQRVALREPRNSREREHFVREEVARFVDGT